MNEMQQQPRLSNRSLTARLLLFAAGMFAFGFLVLPPLYDVFCDITGFGGRTNSTPVAASEDPDLSRTVRIEFVATVNRRGPLRAHLEELRGNTPLGQLPSCFTPSQSSADDNNWLGIHGTFPARLNSVVR